MGVRGWLGAMVLVVACSVAPAHATTMLLMSLEDQVAEATAVFEGEVLSAAATWDATRGRPHLDTVVRVDRVLAGTAPATVQIRQVKGSIQGREVRIAGDGELTPGERVVVLAHRAGDGRWYLVAMAQSVFHVLGDGPEAPVRRDLGGVFLHELSPKGGTVPISSSPLAGVDDLTALRAAIAHASEGL